MKAQSLSVFFFNIKIAHAFSVIGYKEDNNGNFFIQILNPHLKGKYMLNNIKKNSEYNGNKFDNKLFDSQSKGENITEEEFDNNELKYAFNKYSETGQFIMKFNTFYKWIGYICLCDPMLGSNLKPF